MGRVRTSDNAGQLAEALADDAVQRTGRRRLVRELAVIEGWDEDRTRGRDDIRQRLCDRTGAADDRLAEALVRRVRDQQVAGADADAANRSTDLIGGYFH